MSRTYAFGDLHGRADLLNAALAAIVAHAEEPGTVVALGDYIDRGPSSKEVIERLRTGLPAPWKLVCLAGNHEELMLTACRDGLYVDTWLGNGGHAAIASFSAGASFTDPSVIPDDVLDWVEGLRLIYIDQHRVFVHAGVDPDKPLDRQDPHHLTWARTNDERGHGDRHVVHGHTPHVRGPMLSAGRTNLDVKAYQTGRLVIAIFEDNVPGGPVDFIEVKAPVATSSR